jgi:hypothetical protein
LRPRAWLTYEQAVRLHLTPGLGKVSPRLVVRKCAGIRGPDSEGVAGRRLDARDHRARGDGAALQQQERQRPRPVIFVCADPVIEPHAPPLADARATRAAAAANDLSRGQRHRCYHPAVLELLQATSRQSSRRWLPETLPSLLQETNHHGCSCGPNNCAEAGIGQAALPACRRASRAFSREARQRSGAVPDCYANRHQRLRPRLTAALCDQAAASESVVRPVASACRCDAVGPNVRQVRLLQQVVPAHTQGS